MIGEIDRIGQRLNIKKQGRFKVKKSTQKPRSSGKNDLLESGGGEAKNEMQIEVEMGLRKKKDKKNKKE